MLLPLFRILLVETNTLNKKGLRRMFAQHIMRNGRRNQYPEQEGIKTYLPSKRLLIRVGRNQYPEQEGIKTHTERCFSTFLGVETNTLNKKGLRLDTSQ